MEKSTDFRGAFERLFFRLYLRLILNSKVGQSPPAGRCNFKLR